LKNVFDNFTKQGAMLRKEKTKSTIQDRKKIKNKKQKNNAIKRIIENIKNKIMIIE
jgi:hypothetical protein